MSRESSDWTICDACRTRVPEGQDWDWMSLYRKGRNLEVDLCRECSQPVVAALPLGITESGGWRYL